MQKKCRYGRREAARVLSLLQGYPVKDGQLSMARAIQYHAYGYQSLERILAHFGTPKANWELLSQRDQETLQQLTESTRVKIRRSEEYQQMFDEQSQVQGDESKDNESQNNKQNQEPSRGDSPVSGDPEAENDRGTA